MSLSVQLGVALIAAVLLVGVAASHGDGLTSPDYTDRYNDDARDVLTIADREPVAKSAAPSSSSSTSSMVEAGSQYNLFDPRRPKSFRLGPYETRFPFLPFGPEDSNIAAYPYYYKQHDDKWTKVLSKWRYVMADPHPRSKRILTEAMRQYQVRVTRRFNKNMILGFGDDDPEDDDEAYDDFDPNDEGVLIEPIDHRTDQADLYAALKHPNRVVRRLARYYVDHQKDSDNIFRQAVRNHGRPLLLEKDAATTTANPLSQLGRDLVDVTKNEIKRDVRHIVNTGARVIHHNVNKAARAVGAVVGAAAGVVAQATDDVLTLHLRARERKLIRKLRLARQAREEREAHVARKRRERQARLAREKRDREAREKMLREKRLRELRALEKRRKFLIKQGVKAGKKAKKIAKKGKKAKKNVKKGKKALKKAAKKLSKKAKKAAKKATKKAKKLAKKLKKKLRLKGKSKKAKKLAKKLAKKMKKQLKKLKLKKKMKKLKKKLKAAKKAYHLPAHLPPVHPDDHPSRVDKQLRAIHKKLSLMRMKMQLLRDV